MIELISTCCNWKYPIHTKFDSINWRVCPRKFDRFFLSKISSKFGEKNNWVAYEHENIVLKVSIAAKGESLHANGMPGITRILNIEFIGFLL